MTVSGVLLTLIAYHIVTLVEDTILDAIVGRSTVERMNEVRARWRAALARKLSSTWDER